jgi:hypothetical protein
MANSGARFLHTEAAEIQGLSGVAGVLVVAVARARIAAGEVDDMNRDVILRCGANDSGMRTFVIFVRAENQNRFGHWVRREFELACGEDLSSRTYDLHHDAIGAGAIGGK